MKLILKTLPALLVVAGLGTAGITWSQEVDGDQDFDNELFDEEVGEGDWGYDTDEFGAFADDDIVEDQYGAYDQDLDWDVDDEDWDAWYEPDPEAFDSDESGEDGFWDW